MATRKRKPSTNLRGAPSMYTPELAEEILTRLTRGESLLAISKTAGMPGMDAMLDWVVKNRDGFADRYAQSKQVGLEIMADELLQIADSPLEGQTLEESSDGSYKITRADMLGHRRLQVDTRKWLLCKLFPKRYGNRTSVEVTGTGLLDQARITEAERAERLKSLLAIAQRRGDMDVDKTIEKETTAGRI